MDFVMGESILHISEALKNFLCAFIALKTISFSQHWLHSVKYLCTSYLGSLI